MGFMQIFPKCRSSMGNADSLVQDLSLFPFLTECNMITAGTFEEESRRSMLVRSSFFLSAIKKK